MKLRFLLGIWLLSHIFILARCKVALINLISEFTIHSICARVLRALRRHALQLAKLCFWFDCILFGEHLHIHLFLYHKLFGRFLLSLTESCLPLISIEKWHLAHLTRYCSRVLCLTIFHDEIVSDMRPALDYLVVEQADQTFRVGLLSTNIVPFILCLFFMVQTILVFSHNKLWPL